MKYYYSVLRIEPDTILGEFFNYGIMLFSEDLKIHRIKISTQPYLLEAFQKLYPSINFSELIKEEFKNWSQTLKSSKSADEIFRIINKTYPGAMNRVREPLPLLCDKKDLDKKMNFLSEMFINENDNSQSG